MTAAVQKENFCSPWKCLLCYLKRAFYLRFQPFGFLFLSRTWCSLSAPGTAAVLSLQHNLHKLVLSFRWGQVVRETMGDRKTPGSEDLSPFTRTSPGEQTGSDVIAADKCGGGGGVQRAWTSVIPSSPKNDSSPLFALLRSSAAAAPFRAGLEKNALDSFL